MRVTPGIWRRSTMMSIARLVVRSSVAASSAVSRMGEGRGHGKARGKVGSASTILAVDRIEPPPAYTVAPSTRSG
jgi:hypothetical protein